MTKELDALKAQNAELNDRIAKLEEAAKPAEPFVREPWQPIDWTAGMSMPKSALQAMVDCVPDRLMSDLRADSRRPNPVTQAASSTLTTAPRAQPQQRGTGWIDERPLEPPPGIKTIDAMMDAQDARDKAELALRLGKGAAMQSAEKESDK